MWLNMPEKPCFKIGTFPKGMDKAEREIKYKI